MKWPPLDEVTIRKDPNAIVGWFVCDAAGSPLGYAFTKWGAKRIARRWLKLAPFARLVSSPPYSRRTP